jgi:hypothetical protein
VRIAEVLEPKLSSLYELRLVRDTVHGSSIKRVSKVFHFLTNLDAHALKSYEALADWNYCTISGSIIRDV